MSQSLIRLPEAAAVSEQVSSVLGAVSAVLSAGIFYVAFAIALAALESGGAQAALQPVPMLALSGQRALGAIPSLSPP